MASLLNSHEGDVGAVLRCEASVKEILVREDSETVVEQVKLNPLLVQAKHDRLVIEVTVHHVARLSAVGAETTSWHIWNGHGVLRLAVGVVVGVCRVRRQRRNGCSQRSRRLLSTSCCWGT